MLACPLWAGDTAIQMGNKRNLSVESGRVGRGLKALTLSLLFVESTLNSQ